MKLDPARSRRIDAPRPRRWERFDTPHFFIARDIGQHPACLKGTILYTNEIMRHIALECIVAIIGGGVVHGVMLKDASDYAVKRDLLERRYPAYKSFRGLMHSGLMPAATMDDQSSGHDVSSSYFFVLLRPDADASNDAAEGRKDETFRNDTLLIWLNGGPGVRVLVCDDTAFKILYPCLICLPTFHPTVFKYDRIDGRDGASWNADVRGGCSLAQPGTSCEKQIRMDEEIRDAIRGAAGWCWV